jgi:mono/diheme cytochrome c family protein
MYYIDPNVFMNWVVGIILATGALVLVVTILATGRRRRSRRVISYLYMLSALFVCFGLVVAVLGFRGQQSADRPWHFFLDMKYQPKYVAQGESDFFADGRSMRLPVENTIAFDGTDYFADAGFHSNPRADFLKADPRYFHGIADPAAKQVGGDGVEVRTPPTWEGGKLTNEGYYVAHIPDAAVAEAGGWEPLVRRGQQQFGVHCAACHGTSGRGGQGDGAYGIVGAYGLSVAPANLTTDLVRSQPDGQIFNTITLGKASMPGYGHQVKVQDRWAITAYIRVLQYAHQTPK